MNHFFPFLRFILTTILVSGVFSALSLHAQHNWSYDPTDYANSGQIDAVVMLNSTEVTSGTLGAFVGEECRGYTDGKFFDPNGKTIFNLLCYSNASSGETLTFKYYDDVQDTVYAIEETREFVSNMIIGSALTPEVFHAVTNSAPVADCPDKSTLGPLPGPVVFDLCDLFDDPDGDELTFDEQHSTNATVNWLSDCELEFTAAASGTSTLTLIASDGSLQSECSYSFTLSSDNDPPSVANPIGPLTLPEGFTSTQIDLDTVFSDPDNDALVYQAAVEDETVVTAGISGSLLTLTEAGSGNTSITITASDADFNVDTEFDAVVVAANPPQPWEVNPAGFAYSGQIDAVVRANGTELTSGVLAAFVGDECRGKVEGVYFAPGDRTIFSLLAYSDNSAGDILTFRYLDQGSGLSFPINEVIEFKADMRMGSAQSPVELNFTTANEPPVVSSPIGDQVVAEHFNELTFNMEEVFSDPDTDILTYSASTSDPGVATVSISGSTLTIAEAGPGTSVINVSAGDGSITIDDRFTLEVTEVNDPPVVENPLSDQTLQEGFGTKNVRISGTFSDPEDDVLDYSVTSNELSVIDVALSGSNLVIKEQGVGTATVSLCVDDGEYQVCEDFEVTVTDVNFSPDSICSYLPDTILVQNVGTATISTLCNAFDDPDGDELTYTVSSSDPEVVTAGIDGCDLVLTETGLGTSQIEVCVTDGEFESCCTFSVTVVEENTLELYVMDDPLQEGDSIKRCADSALVTLIVYSQTPWEFEKNGSWFMAEKINNFNIEIKFPENTTGENRSGSIAVRDTQDHVLNLTIFQSGSCDPNSTVSEPILTFTGYPNPVTDYFYIERNSEAQGAAHKAVIYHISGRKVEEVPVNHRKQTRIEFDMRGYRPGVYYIRIMDERGAGHVLPVVKR